MRSLRLAARRSAAAVAVAAVMALAPMAWAVDGTWNVNLFGEWDLNTNWVGGTIADGAGSTANFTQPDLATGSTQVNLSTARTIGNLVFSDQNPGTGADLNWDLTGTGLTLEGGTPTVTVNAMNQGGAAILSLPVAGTAGLTKAGAGTLRLGAATHTFTGGINVNGGTLRIDDGSVVPVQAITLRNGATLSVANGIGTATTGVINIPAGMTGTIVSRLGNLPMNAGNIAAVGGGAGSTLNVTTDTDGATISAGGNWATGGSLGTVNVSGIAGGAPELFIFNVNGAGLGAANFLNTAVNLNEVTAFTRTNSGGNTVDIGSLSGNAAAVLSGGGQAGGTVVRYSIGALNTDTEFAGTIDSTSAPTPNTTGNLGGMDLNKVGTGTLTLSGTLNYQPNMHATANLRGGITTVTAGRLRLTNAAAIAGGQAAGFESTVRVLSGATLDVAGATTPYSTAAFQNVIGDGTIAGNYIHDEGTLAPADTITNNTPTLINTAGTLTFANNLSFAGTGAIQYSMAATPATGNDLIRVNGTTSLTGTPTLNFSFLTGTFSQGSYTILQSDGGFAGTNPSGWVVNWGARGTPTLQVNGNLLQLLVGPIAPGTIRWTGNSGSDWVVGNAGPLNWHNQTTNVADRYFDQDNITFADTFGAANTPVTNGTVNLNTVVTPLSVAVNNSSVAYSITGTGRITGTTTFTKSGTGTLVMQVANNFSGAASLQGGTVDVGNFGGALGTGALTMSGATVLGGSGGGLTNSSLAITAATTNTIETNGPTGSGNTFSIPTLSGGGTLTIRSTSGSPVVDPPVVTNGKWFALNATNTFTGTLNLVGPAATQQPLTVRTTTGGGGGTNFPNAVVNLTNARMANRQGGAGMVSFTYGELHGDAASILAGFEGGTDGRPDTNWVIGGLNTNSDFAGNITNPGGSNTAPNPDRPAISLLTKIGTGTLTLTGAKSYTGNTNVLGGTLSVNNAYFADTADVSIATGATLNLNTVGAIDTIRSLFLHGLAVPVGTYGAVGSGLGAPFETPLISGSGFLTVSTYVLQGDYDNNNVVNNLDVARFKESFGVTAGGDADFDGDTDGNDYMILQRQIGKTNPPSATAVSGAVPEPATGLLTIAALGVIAAAGRSKRR